MYIDLESLFWIIIGIIAGITLVYLIITLNNICKLIKNINGFMERNSKSLECFCNKIPNITNNLDNIIINAKDISDVATEVTAEAIVAKENFTSYYDTVKDILDIIINVFLKK